MSWLPARTGSSFRSTFRTRAGAAGQGSIAARRSGSIGFPKTRWSSPSRIDTQLGGSMRPPGDAAFRREDLKGSTIEASYAGALSFARRKYSRDLSGVDIAVTGIPFDQAVTNRPGTRFGPEAIRRASAQHAWGPIWPWFFDPFDTLAVIDYGDCSFDWGRKEDVPGAIEQHVSEIIEKGASTLSLGGDHFVSYPVLKAY